MYVKGAIVYAVASFFWKFKASLPESFFLLDRFT